MENLTSEKDFNVFVKECKKWIKVFGLFDWEICFEHFDNEDASALAACYYDVPGKSAYILLYQNFYENEISDSLLKKCAFHEVCELLLGKLKCYCETDLKLTNNQIQEAVHTVIRRLENSIFKNS